MNGIIYGENVYEIHKGDCCDKCAFYNSNTDCAYWRDHCEAYECAFRYSQSLTDKLNGK